MSGGRDCIPADCPLRRGGVLIVPRRFAIVDARRTKVPTVSFATSHQAPLS
jgi:hypothetical protein